MEVIMGRYTGNGPEWVSDPARAHAATRAQVAVALYTNLSGKIEEPASDKSAVYMTTDISSDGLVAIYKALKARAEGKIAVKLSTEEPGSNYLRTDLIGELVQSLDATIVECNTAYGGAIKNISIGIASSHGKSHIHSGGTGGSMWSGDQDAFLESMAEAGKSVVDALDGNILYINVMNRLSVDCDCDGNPAEPDMHDIGILASYDPVAVDQACVDLVYAAEDGSKLVQRIESRNGLHTLEQAEKIGLGSREYDLISIDGQAGNEEGTAMKISVRDTSGTTVVYELNDSPAAQALYAQLPITTEVGNFSTNEKTFDPTQTLDTTGATAIYEAEAGTLAYYAPWGNIAMFYDSLSNGGSGLYILGQAESGVNEIQKLSGTITITATD